MELLKKLYKIHSPSRQEGAMISYLRNYLTYLRCDVRVDEIGNIYVTKGKGTPYPCIVAHTDEVHTYKPKDYRIIETKDNIFGYSNKNKCSVGTGADDKNGIWVALKCLELYDNIKVAFFVSEEIGCIGSQSADLTFFDDCRFVLQCDRQGGKGFVTKIYGLPLCGDDFVNDIRLQNFGYHVTDGLMTDVYQLKSDGLSVSTCNICCGYYNPHTDKEYTVKSELYNCLDLVMHIIEDTDKVYPHQAKLDDELYFATAGYVDERLYDIERTDDELLDFAYYWYSTYPISKEELNRYFISCQIVLTEEKLTEIYEQTIYLYNENN